MQPNNSFFLKEIKKNLYKQTLLFFRRRRRRRRKNPSKFLELIISFFEFTKTWINKTSLLSCRGKNRQNFFGKFFLFYFAFPLSNFYKQWLIDTKVESWVYCPNNLRNSLKKATIKKQRKKYLSFDKIYRNYNFRNISFWKTFPKMRNYSSIQR